MNIDSSLVSLLIVTQFPQWADLAIKPIEFGGCDNRTFYLGKHMTVRLPSAAEYALRVEKEQYWLPKLAPFLPLQISFPLAMGEPSEGYPWHWSVYRWLDGETASIERITDMRQFAVSLAKFLVALQKIDVTGGPIAGEHNFYRGGPLATYDAETRHEIAILDSIIDADAVTVVWNAALASTWHGSPVWVHGDIAVGNLLVQNGKLSAVIDFGCFGIGDPACDLAIAWTFFTGESREVFRVALQLDNDTWARGRGWALWKALITKDRRVLDEVLVDYKFEK